MSSDLPKFTLRIPKELMDQIKVIATENGRSVNKEIEYVLKQYALEQKKNN